MAQHTANTDGGTEQDDIEWESELEYNEREDYDRSAHGKLVIDGPQGRLIVLKTYRAMLEDDNDLMEPEQIAEHSKYYREGDREPFTDGNHEWDVSDDDIEDKEQFLEQCRASLEADPQVEYEQQANRL